MAGLILYQVYSTFLKASSTIVLKIMWRLEWKLKVAEANLRLCTFGTPTNPLSAM